MALSEHARNTIFEFLAPNIGEEAAREMLSNFPTDGSAPASEDFVRNEFAAVRVAIAGHDGRIASLEDRMGGFDERMERFDQRMASVEDRLTIVEGRLTTVEHRLIEGFAAIKVEVHDGFARQTRFLMTSFIAVLAVLVASNAIFR